MTKGWQEQALADAMAANRGMISNERMTLRLANPAEAARLDDIILSYLWPGAKRGLDGTQWKLWTGTKENLREEITTTGYPRHTQRSLNAIITDPRRPIGPGQSPPWFCRIEIDVQTHGYHLHRDTSLSFPDTFSWPKLQQLIKEPELQGCPPGLLWSSPYSAKQGEFTVRFTGGSGHAWLPVHLDVAEQRDGTPMAHAVEDNANLFEWNAVRVVQVAEAAEKVVRGHVGIAQAMDVLAVAWQSTKRFNVLHDAVLAVYEAW